MFQHNFAKTFSFYLETYPSKLEDILQTQLYHLVFTEYVRVTLNNSDKSYYVEEYILEL